MFGQTLAIMSSALLTFASGGMICPNGQIPDVRMGYHIDAPVFDRSHNKEEIHALAVSQGKDATFATPLLGVRGWHAEGFTHVYTRTGINVPARTLTDGATGRSCIAFDEIEITMEMSQTVYLNNDEQADSCNAQVTVQHEQVHIKDNEAVYEAYRHIVEDWAKSESARYFYDIGTGPFTQQEAEGLYRRVNAHFKYGFDMIMASMDKEIRKRQQGIDTEENYRTLSTLCP